MRRRHVFAPLMSVAGFLVPWARAQEPTGRSAKVHAQRTQDSWLAAARLPSLRLGDSAHNSPELVFFVDPNCPNCAALWHWFNTTPWKNRSAHWIPVAYMNKTSLGRGVAMLRSADPRQALSQNYDGFDFVNKMGGLPEASTPAPQELNIVRGNTRVWRTEFFGATPLTLYRSRQNTYWQVLGFFSPNKMNEYLVELSP